MIITGLFHGTVEDTEAGLMAEEAERGQRPAAQCQLLASPQLRGYGVLLLVRSGLVYMLVCGSVCVCACTRDDIKPCLAEAEQNRSPHCD